MLSIFLTLGTFVLILVSLFLVLVILMQRGSVGGGMGAAFGGGFTESTFGADTGNVLTRATIWATVAFFILALFLYLGHMIQTTEKGPKLSIADAVEPTNGFSIPAADAPLEPIVPAASTEPAAEAPAPVENPAAPAETPAPLPAEAPAP